MTIPAPTADMLTGYCDRVSACRAIRPASWANCDRPAQMAPPGCHSDWIAGRHESRHAICSLSLAMKKCSTCRYERESRASTHLEVDGHA